MTKRKIIEGIPILCELLLLFRECYNLLLLRKQDINFVLNDEVMNAIVFTFLVLILYLLNKASWHIVFVFSLVLSFFGYLSFSSVEYFINIGFGEINLLSVLILTIYLFTNFSYWSEFQKNVFKNKQGN